MFVFSAYDYVFHLDFFNKVIRDDSQTHTNLCPSLLSL